MVGTRSGMVAAAALVLVAPLQAGAAPSAPGARVVTVTAVAVPASAGGVEEVAHHALDGVGVRATEGWATFGRTGYARVLAAATSVRGVSVVWTGTTMLAPGSAVPSETVAPGVSVVDHVADDGRVEAEVSVLDAAGGTFSSFGSVDDGRVAVVRLAPREPGGDGYLVMVGSDVP